MEEHTGRVAGNVRAVLFDLDDTLLETQPAWTAGVKAAFGRLAEAHPHVPTRAVETAWARVNAALLAEVEAGLPVARARDVRFALLLETLGLPDPTLAAEMETLLGTAQLRALRLYPDAEVLGTLRPRYRLAIVTNGAADDAADSQTAKIRRLGLRARVDAVAVSDAFERRKPDPAIFLHVAQVLGVPPEGCWMVGDSLRNDVEGAVAAGMAAVWLDRENAGLPGPYRHRVRTLSELPGLLVP